MLKVFSRLSARRIQRMEFYRLRQEDYICGASFLGKDWEFSLGFVVMHRHSNRDAGKAVRYI